MLGPADGMAHEFLEGKFHQLKHLVFVCQSIDVDIDEKTSMGLRVSSKSTCFVWYIRGTPSMIDVPPQKSLLSRLLYSFS